MKKQFLILENNAIQREIAKKSEVYYGKKCTSLMSWARKHISIHRALASNVKLFYGDVDMYGNDHNSDPDVTDAIAMELDFLALGKDMGTSKNPYISH